MSNSDNKENKTEGIVDMSFKDFFVTTFSRLFNRIYFFMFISVILWNAREIVIFLKDDNYFSAVVNIWGSFDITLWQQCKFTAYHILLPAGTGLVLSICMPYVALGHNKITNWAYSTISYANLNGYTNAELIALEKEKKSKKDYLKNIDLVIENRRQKMRDFEEAKAGAVKSYNKLTEEYKKYINQLLPATINLFEVLNKAEGVEDLRGIISNLKDVELLSLGGFDTCMKNLTDILEKVKASNNDLKEALNDDGEQKID